MLIKLNDHFRGKKPGEVIDWPDGMAAILIAQKRAVAVDAVKGAPVTDKSVDEPPVDKSMAKRVIAKRK